mgnify:CR=1 FL=1
MPSDEWDAISLNYTSGTTGDPKGVVYHHRGAHLLAVNNVITCGMSIQASGQRPVYLWTLPMFHCNGWCFPWTLSAIAGTHVCLRAVRAKAMYDALADHGVTHLCGAPIVMSTLLGASAADGAADGLADLDVGRRVLRRVDLVGGQALRLVVRETPLPPVSPDTEGVALQHRE